MTVFLAAVLAGMCVGLLVWYFAYLRVEEKMIDKRAKKAFGGETFSGTHVALGELLKSEFAEKKSGFRRFFDFSVMPNVDQWAFFFVIWAIISFLIAFKLPATWFIKIFFIGAITLLLQRILNIAAIRRRINELRKELPGALDLVVICMEAGLSINAAFLRVSTELQASPLGKELRQTFNEIQAGATLEDALSHLAKRTKLPEINSVVVAIVQAQKMGTPISGSLRIQVDVLHEKMIMATKEYIMKIPVKILFPLVFCIFPVLFIIVLGPAVIDIFQYLSGSK